MLQLLQIYLKIVLTFCFLFLIFLLNANAEAFPVKFDCRLQAARVSCKDIRDSLFSSMTFLEEVQTEARVSIDIRTTGSDERSTRYILEFKGSGDLPSFVLYDDIPLTVSGDATLVRLVVDLQKCLAPYLTMKTIASTDEKGTLTLSLSPDLFPNNPGSIKTTTGWYQAYSATGFWTVGDIKTINMNASASVNYSDFDWRLTAGGRANYQRVTVANNGTEETQEIISFSNRTLIARTIDRGWSVAAIVTAGHYPEQNVNLERAGYLGLAWDLVPFLNGEDRSMGVRYLIGLNRQDYLVPNVLGEEAKLFVENSLDYYANWHFNRLDIESRIGVNTLVRDIRFSGLGGGVGLTWRITDSLSASLNSDVMYRRAMINAPKAKTAKDGLEQFLKGGNFAKLTYNGLFSLTYTYGNSALHRQDQRWKL